MIEIPISINRAPVRYSIKIQKGIVTEQGLPAGFIITDTNVFRLYQNLILRSGNAYTIIEAGEKSKSPENYIEIAKTIPKNTDRITALGGGVAGDISAFIASTYKRGTLLTQIPSTLLAMVDSSIGGKNGVNLGERKNYLGTISQPLEILTDINFLKTLPEIEFKNGKAEVIKYGAIADKSILERCQRHISWSDEDLEKIIAKCCKIKAEFVELDEGDKKERHALNFGHTIGHALEIPYGLSHGIAISIGQVYESEVAREMGIMDNFTVNSIKEALKANNLPTQLPMGVNIARIIELIKQDKKGSLIFSFDKKHYAVKVNERDLIKILSK